MEIILTELFTFQEASDFLLISQTTLRAWRKEGYIQAKNISLSGRPQWRIYGEELLRISEIRGLLNNDHPSAIPGESPQETALRIGYREYVTKHPRSIEAKQKATENRDKRLKEDIKTRNEQRKKEKELENGNN